MKKPLAENDTLGNAAAHFFKSGNVTRSDANDALGRVTALIPKEGNHGTRLEYDLWYDIKDKNAIHGYVYTDMLTSMVYMKPASAARAYQIMRTSTLEPITEEGEMLFKDIGTNNNDKYNLKKARKSYKFVIFLAGTNCINDVMDFDKIENAVKQGAYLKCHPLTSIGLVTNLKNRFGADKIIDKKVSGHQLLEEAAIVGCAENSEMGLVALAKGKTVYMFDKAKRSRSWTYTPIYRAISEDGRLNPSKFKSILSSRYSGLIPSQVDDPENRIELFFTYFKGVPHVKPRNSGDK